MEREHPKRFTSILDRISRKIPGVDNIDTTKTADGRLLLRFNDKGFKDPFYAQQMSDGTLKVFAYLYFVDAMSPDEVWVLEKLEDGFSSIRRAGEEQVVRNMVAEGLPLGGLWYSDYLDAR